MKQNGEYLFFYTVYSGKKIPSSAYGCKASKNYKDRGMINLFLRKVCTIYFF